MEVNSVGDLCGSAQNIFLLFKVFKCFYLFHLQLRLSLKQRRLLSEPTPMPQQQQQQQLLPLASAACNPFSMLKWLKKLLHLSKKKEKSKGKEDKVPRNEEMRDELLLVILPDQHYEVPIETDHQKKTKAKLYKLAETRTTQRRHRRRSHQLDTVERTASINNNYNNNNCIRRRRKEAPLRNSVRNKLATLLVEMNVRYEKEYNLTRQLTEKCKQYKLQNELYTSPEMEVSVGQLQRNIEAYAEDIIKTEHELLELKKEIKQDISLINNLKRMTLEKETDTNPPGNIAQSTKPKSEEVTNGAKNPQEMQFVDNIYEFCDNNASMLV